MTLKVDEFIRRFLLHVLPARYVRIRRFGLLANRNRKDNVALCRKILGGRKTVTKETIRQETWQEQLQGDQQVKWVDLLLLPLWRTKLPLLQPIKNTSKILKD
jgi:hypothetical protein